MSTAFDPTPLDGRTSPDAPAETGPPSSPRAGEDPVVLLYGDVDLNVLDGSAVWLGSMAETWVAAGAEVHVQLKAHERRDVLTAGLRALAGVTLHEARPEPGKDQMDRPRAVGVLEELAERVHPDVVMVRGIHLCAEAARRGVFPGRLWSYVTELGYPATSAAPVNMKTVREVAAASRVMLAQTEDARAVLEAFVPEAAGRTLFERLFERDLAQLDVGHREPSWPGSASSSSGSSVSGWVTCAPSSASRSSAIADSASSATRGRATASSQVRGATGRPVYISASSRAAASEVQTRCSWESWSWASNSSPWVCSIEVIHQEKWVHRQTRASALSE